LEQIQFLLGHASVQTTERYLGCKQNLGHPVNDLFELKTDTRDVNPVTVQSSASVEIASPQGIECHDGGSEHERPVGQPTAVSPPERTGVVEVGKGHRPQSLRRCSGARLQEVIREAKQKAAQIKQPADLWDLEHYLINPTP
jgi:hypothetical protein